MSALLVHAPAQMAGMRCAVSVNCHAAGATHAVFNHIRTGRAAMQRKDNA
ncbi:hypothetical protein J8I26_13455 [Herbaspirillum sp. LeCh32-8]|nr:hypothetical protein [Herbaspirillum sp. LeCh32-8]MBP0599120.1 hypothetical protein [Herbaspirillum sp. LeCh32-8]